VTVVQFLIEVFRLAIGVNFQFVLISCKYSKFKKISILKHEKHFVSVLN
jgi:hypothetical protein